MRMRMLLAKASSLSSPCADRSSLFTTSTRSLSRCAARAGRGAWAVWRPGAHTVRQLALSEGHPAGTRLLPPPPHTEWPAPCLHCHRRDDCRPGNGPRLQHGGDARAVAQAEQHLGPQPMQVCLDAVKAGDVGVANQLGGQREAPAACVDWVGWGGWDARGGRQGGGGGGVSEGAGAACACLLAAASVWLTHLWRLPPHQSRFSRWPFATGRLAQSPGACADVHGRVTERRVQAGSRTNHAVPRAQALTRRARQRWGGTP